MRSLQRKKISTDDTQLAQKERRETCTAVILNLSYTVLLIKKMWINKHDPMILLGLMDLSLIILLLFFQSLNVEHELSMKYIFSSFEFLSFSTSWTYWVQLICNTKCINRVQDKLLIIDWWFECKWAGWVYCIYPDWT